jgi:integrase
MRESYQGGTLIQVGPSWFIRYRERDLHGAVIHRSEKVGSVAQFPTRAKAEKAAEEIRKRVNERRPVVTFAELADRYDSDVMPTLRPHTQISNASNLAHLREKFASKRLDEITPGEMELWLNELCGVNGQPLSRLTRRHVRNLAHKLWRQAMLWGYISTQVNPISIVRVTKGARPKPRSKVTVDAEVYDKLLSDALLPAATKMMVRVAMTTGMGISEILGLRWEDSIDFRRGVIHVLRSADGKHINDTKNEFRENAVPMHSELADALRQWKQAEPSWGGWVFGSPLTSRPFHAGIMQADHLKPAGVRAGCLGLGWHSFRHTYSVAMESAGASDRVQQRAMRHASSEMTREYGKHSPALLEAARKAQKKVVKNLRVPKAVPDMM